MTIAIYTLKGGAGKSTTALNLGAAFLLRGHAVRLIDLDGSGTLYEYRHALNGAHFERGWDAPGIGFDGLTIIDCPPALPDVRALSIIRRADLVIVPTHPARVAVNEALDAAVIAATECESVYLLMTKHVAQKAYSREALALLYKATSKTEIGVLRTVIPFSHTLVEAENELESVLHYAPKSAVSRAYVRLAREIESEVFL